MYRFSHLSTKLIIRINPDRFPRLRKLRRERTISIPHYKNLYFTDYKGAMLASGLFAGVAGLATAVSLLLPQQFYGFGFLLGAAVFFIVALLRLDTYTANLPYRILSQQPMVATDKTGRFTQLGRLLDRAEQRYEEGRHKGEPHGWFERTVVRVYRNHWGGSDDR